MKILVVDDLPDNRYLMEQLLRAKGHEVATANDGIEALDLLKAGKFDLIIADIMMPRMDGFELCYNIKLNPNVEPIPFVFYSATYTAEDDRAFALSLGADAFIVKPEEPEDFVRRLNDVLANAGRNVPTAPLRLRRDQVAFLKGYNERLLKKLKQKVEEAQEANEKLNDLNRHLESRVLAKTRELERSNRELESFAYTLTHDLRSPLRAIVGFTDALRDSAAQTLNATEKSYLEKVMAAAERMDRMIQEVLEYSAIGADVGRAPVDVEAVVRDVIQSTPHLQNRTRILSSLHPMLAHERSLKQVVANLLGNAVKFVRPDVESRVYVRSEMRDGEVRLWVEDNGIGIEPEQQSKIFQLFERAHAGYEGSGIGLAIVAKAVERMQGKFGVESEVGKGSRFWLQLPPVERGS